MVKILSFAEALEDAHARCDDLTVLLGNGFSIEYDHEKFAYESLAAEATLESLSVSKEELFAQLGTSNFEIIVDKLHTAAIIQSLYGGSNEIISKLKSDATVVRNGLADALAVRHPDSARSLLSEELTHARTFLGNFSRIFTLSYDLLLYWVVNGDDHGIRVPRSDGFEYEDWHQQGPLIWKKKPSQARQRIYFLHGALHLFVKNSRLTKLAYGLGSPIIDTLRTKLEAGEYPLVVTEGTRNEKEARIERSAYLRNSLRRFGEVEGALFMHGFSMSHNDDHILQAVSTAASKVEALYVALHGDRRSTGAKALIARAQAVKADRVANGGANLRLRFYDSSTANAWRDNSI